MASLGILGVELINHGAHKDDKGDGEDIATDEEERRFDGSRLLFPAQRFLLQSFLSGQRVLRWVFHRQTQRVVHQFIKWKPFPLRYISEILVHAGHITVDLLNVIFLVEQYGHCQVDGHEKVAGDEVVKQPSDVIKVAQYVTEPGDHPAEGEDGVRVRLGLHRQHQHNSPTDSLVAER